MLRIFLLIILLLTGCSDRDRSTTDPNNHEQTEETSSEVSNEPESNTESEEEANVARQLPENKGGFFSTVLNFILWGLIIVLIGGLTIVIYLKRKEYRKRISQLKWEASNYRNKYHESDRKLKRIIEKNHSLKITIKRISNEKKELEEIVSKRGTNSGENNLKDTTKDLSDTVRVVSENKETKVDRKEEELFFELPSEYGKFKHGNGVSSLEERRLYKLTYRRGESEGKIEFISGKYDGIAINHKDSMIKPACSIIKENENNPSSVHQLSPGIVKRDGEEWIIDNKIKVEIR